MNISFDFSDVIKTLESGRTIINPKDFGESLKESAEIVFKRYRQLAKISKSGKGTGAYARGLKIVMKDNSTVFVSSPTRQELASLNDSYNPNKEYYPAIQHYGSDVRNIEANPVIVTALEQASAEAINVFKRRMTQKISNMSLSSVQSRAKGKAS